MEGYAEGFDINDATDENYYKELGETIQRGVFNNDLKSG